MPAYEYTCHSCQAREVRIAGIDDHTVACDACGQPMVREADVATILASYARPQGGPTEQIDS
jgi:putative FmdB family regulatory protein